MSELTPESDPPTDAAKPSSDEMQAMAPRQIVKLFMDGADPIVIRNLDGHVLDMNRETERLFGWTLDEVRGARTRHLLLPEYRAMADNVLARVQQGETVRNVEAAVRSKSGKVVPVLATVFLLKDEHNQALGYAEIIKDISELKQTTTKLQQRNQELKQFANVLAHDLGAPLRSIRSFADLLEQRCGEDLGDDCRDYLRCVIEGAQRMERLVSDLLEFTRIDRQEAALEPVDLERVLADVRANLHAVINEQQATITNDPLPTIRANATQMVQLLQNLIDNAIKFCHQSPPQVHVTAKPLPGRWQFEVRDNGVGIAADQRQRIFDVFSRLHHENEFPGTGVGLAICKTIVEHHGGQIWVESTPGDGATFHFTIPEPPRR